MEKVEETKEEKLATGEEKAVKDIQKVYIKNYGNLALEIVGTNEIGLSAHSKKRNEDLFIPWSSIIMISKVIDEPGS